MNVADQVDAVIRRVATTGEEHIVVLEQTFATTPADFWAACTDPERLPRWFEPVEGDLRQGGRYRLTGSGTEGTIERCVPPAVLRITWEYAGAPARPARTWSPWSGRVTTGGAAAHGLAPTADTTRSVYVLLHRVRKLVGLLLGEVELVVRAEETELDGLTVLTEFFA